MVIGRPSLAEAQKINTNKYHSQLTFLSFSLWVHARTNVCITIRDFGHPAASASPSLHQLAALVS